MKRLGLTVITTLLAAPLVAGGGLSARAQDIGIPIQNSAPDAATLEKRQKIDQDYRAAVGRTPVQETGPRDPWANMRGPDEKPAATAAKPPPKKKGAATTAR